MSEHDQIEVEDLIEQCQAGEELRAVLEDKSFLEKALALEKVKAPTPEQKIWWVRGEIKAIDRLINRFLDRHPNAKEVLPKMLYDLDICRLRLVRLHHLLTDEVS